MAGALQCASLCTPPLWPTTSLLTAPLPSGWSGMAPTHACMPCPSPNHGSHVQEQTRAFVVSIVPKAQRVAPIVITTKKGGAASGGGGPKSPGSGPAGGLGAKEAAAKEAAAKLPKLKKGRGADGTQAGGSSGGKAQPGGSSGGGVSAQGEMSAIAEASREGSRLA